MSHVPTDTVDSLNSLAAATDAAIVENLKVVTACLRMIQASVTDLITRVALAPEPIQGSWLGQSKSGLATLLSDQVTPSEQITIIQERSPALAIVTAFSNAHDANTDLARSAHAAQLMFKKTPE